MTLYVTANASSFIRACSRIQLPVIKLRYSQSGNDIHKYGGTRKKRGHV